MHGHFRPSPELCAFRDWMLAPITDLLRRSLRLEVAQMTAIDNMTAEVREARTVQDAAIALLQGLKSKLDEAIASGDMGRLQALSDELSANTDALAAAVAANTPAQSGGDTGGDTGSNPGGDPSTDPNATGEQSQV